MSMDLTASGYQRGRFSWSGMRTDGMIFDNLEAAFSTRRDIRPFKLAVECQIRREPDKQEYQKYSPGDAWRVVG